MAERNDGNVEVKLVNVRLSFPALFKPEVNENEDGTKTKKFKGSFLIDPSTKQGKKNIAAMEEAIEAAKDAKWKGKPPKLREEKLCLRDGNDYDWDGYADHYFVSSSNSKRPAVIDADKAQLVEEDGKPYAGCFVNAIVRVWAQDNKHGKRVNASLEAVQFYKDGDSFSGYTPINTDEAFDDVSDEDEDEKPKKSKSRSRDEDEDEAPKKAKKRPSRDEDEDEDDRPAKKKRSSRDEDEDEDEKPRKKSRRSRDEEDED